MNQKEYEFTCTLSEVQKIAEFIYENKCESTLVFKSDDKEIFVSSFLDKYILQDGEPYHTYVLGISPNSSINIKESWLYVNPFLGDEFLSSLKKEIGYDIILHDEVIVTCEMWYQYNPNIKPTKPSI
jgi:hypothetical protein